MNRKFNVAVVGATGAAGETLLEILKTRQFPLGNLYLLASERSAGTAVEVGHKTYLVEKLDDFDFSNADIAFFCAGGDIFKKYAPMAAKAGCISIDKSSYFRLDPEVPFGYSRSKSTSVKKFIKQAYYIQSKLFNNTFSNGF